MNKLTLNYHVHCVVGESYQQGLTTLFSELSLRKGVIRIVLFGNPDGTDQYIAQKEQLINLRDEYIKDTKPLISFIAQEPLNGTIVAEVQCLKDDSDFDIKYSEQRDLPFVLVQQGENKALFGGSIQSDDLNSTIQEQCELVFERFNELLSLQGFNMNSIVRQWNIIEQITAVNNGSQHYQDLNDARSRFYSKTEWINGYPAATGIGSSFGGLQIEFDAFVSDDPNVTCVAIDNKLQIAAHAYSNNVLISEAKKPTTPKFERAKAILNNGSGLIYISGTAAIRGELSLADMDIEEQTRITLENIEYLISKENLTAHQITGNSNPALGCIRVYLKYASDYEYVKEYIDRRYPRIPAVYLLADVCRDELLIEIEGIAYCK